MGRVRLAERSVVSALTIGGAFLAISAPTAAAAPKPITGKLDKPGYTVIALASDGEAKTDQAKRGRFALRPPAKSATLHLRSKEGTYAGPIVVGRDGKRAIMGARAGAELGRVEVRLGRGYAKPARRLPEEFINPALTARAKNGAPIGAGRFGRVRSRHTHGGVPGDRDLDGIPDPLDIDDDGDLILDNLDLSTAGGGARAAQSEGGCGPDNFYCQPVASGLGSPFSLEGTVNVNAGSTLAEIDARSVSLGTLRFGVGNASAFPELDCASDPQAEPPRPGLLYCSTGGSGEAAAGGPFPECCDLDGDGFGTLDPAFNMPFCSDCPPTDFFLGHGAVPRRPGLDPTTSQIGSGDLMIERIPSGDTETEVLAVINYVFATTPALASFNDEVKPETNVLYPVAQGDPGTSGNGFPVADGPDPDEDVELILTFWRAQRHAIADSDPPGAEWMDLGHLRYTAGVATGGGGGSCPQSTLSSSDLTPPLLPLLNQASLEDLSSDQESSPANTFTYTLNLSQCLAANGLTSSFDEAGEELTVGFTGMGGSSDGAGHGAAFVRQ